MGGVWPGPAFPRLAQGHTICENAPFSGLPTVIDKRFAGSSRALGVPAKGALGWLGSAFGWVVTSKLVFPRQFSLDRTAKSERLSKDFPQFVAQLPRRTRAKHAPDLPGLRRGRVTAPNPTGRAKADLGLIVCRERVVHTTCMYLASAKLKRVLRICSSVHVRAGPTARQAAWCTFWAVQHDGHPPATSTGGPAASLRVAASMSLQLLLLARTGAAAAKVPIACNDCLRNAVELYCKDPAAAEVRGLPRFHGRTA